MKQCNKCKQFKSEVDYFKSTYTKDGLYSLCIECKRASNLERSRLNRDKINNQARKRYAERVLTDTEYVQKKRDSSRKSRSKPENRGRINKAHREWARNNRHLRRESDRKQNARRRQIIDAYAELIYKDDIWERDVGICGVCELPADSFNWHLDHIIPLSRGGTHTHSNVQVSHPTCNLRKNNRLQEEIS